MRAGCISQDTYLLYIMIICVVKCILHKTKSIFMQLLESPIPPLTAAALRMIICKRAAPHFDNHKKGMVNAFLKPLIMRKNVFCVSKNQTSIKKDNNFHISLRSGLTGLTPPPHHPPPPHSLMVSLIVKYRFFYASP